ncbi:MAG: hypothetical protein D6693_02260 [Planctomycetota bacterium]|nr:MAG: hypothetical protein D6693_02260 [Planctomycetota bacterium]
MEFSCAGRPERSSASAPRPARPWLSVWFRCCHVYARVYRAPTGDRYVGRCPRCGGEVSARIGPGGTTRRFFEAC